MCKCHFLLFAATILILHLSYSTTSAVLGRLPALTEADCDIALLPLPSESSPRRVFFHEVWEVISFLPPRRRTDCLRFQRARSFMELWSLPCIGCTQVSPRSATSPTCITLSDSTVRWNDSGKSYLLSSSRITILYVSVVNGWTCRPTYSLRGILVSLYTMPKGST
jgi:hypothetical protein